MNPFPREGMTLPDGRRLRIVFERDATAGRLEPYGVLDGQRITREQLDEILMSLNPPPTDEELRR